MNTDVGEGFVCAGPPVPSSSVRISERAAHITPSTIFFKFNCSWFSDNNGAIRHFAIIVTEADGTFTLQHTVLSGVYWT